MYAMKRLELIIERMALKRAGRILQNAGIKGYTVVPALAGFGNGTQWQRDRDMSASQDMVVVISISSGEAIERALEDLENLLGAHIGVLDISDVRVLRPDRF